MRLRLLIVFLLSVIITAGGDFVSGQTACPSSGAAQVSTTTYNLYQLTVLAPTTNAGTVYIGPSTVTSTTGFVLIAGASYNATKPNAGVSPQNLYFTCSNTSDKVAWIGSR